MDAVPVPEYLDNPIQLAFWESDEIAPVFVLFGVGIITGTLTYMIIPMYFFHKFFVRFKSMHMRGYLFHMLYRAGIMPLNKRFQNGAITYYFN